MGRFTEALRRFALLVWVGQARRERGLSLSVALDVWGVAHRALGSL